MSFARFKTPEVAQLFQDVREWCHPDYPFLDPLYSPNSNVPAVDFTSFVANWLQEGRLEAVAELWTILTLEGDPSRYAFRQVIAARLPPWLLLSETAKHELHAIYILSMRASMIGGQAAAYVGGSLAATTVASRELQLDSRFQDEFARIIGSEITKESFLGSQYGKAKGARCALERAQSSLGLAGSASERLKAVPPMARAVVYDYLARNWGEGTVRFDLSYDDRLYGCGGKWNQRFIEWLGFFGRPVNITKIPQALTKDILREALEQHGTVVKKTASKEAMVDQARAIDGLLGALVARVCPNRLDLRPEWNDSVRDWAERVQYCAPLGNALLKLLALNAMKFK